MGLQSTKLVLQLVNQVPNLFKMRHPFETVKTVVNLGMRQAFDSLGAKLLHIKRRHHRTKNHCSSHRAFIQRVLARQVTHETSGKRITGASRIKNRLEWIRRNRKITVSSKQR